MSIKILLSFLTLFCLNVLGSKAQPTFKELNINNGLPHTDAHDAVQDSKGFLWLATLDGLCRYDGEELIVYRNIHLDPNSISNNRINCLLYDHNRKGLWIGTQGGGLNFLNMETGKFLRMKITDPAGEEMTEVIALQLLENGAVWVGTTKGAYSANPGTIVNTLSTFKNVAPYIKNFINSIYEHENNDIWLGTLNGLLYLPAGGKRFSAISPANFGSVNAVKKFDRDHVLLGTSEGLYKLNTTTFSFEKFSDMNTSSVLKDEQDRIWVGTFSTGLFQLNTSGQVQQQLPVSDNRNFRNDNVKSIFIDKFESIFICTSGSGIKILNQNNHIFVSHPLNLPPKEFAKIKKPLTFYSSDKKLIWIGTKGHGLALYNRQAETYTLFEINGGSQRLPAHQDVISLNETESQDLLAGTASGLFRIAKADRLKAIQIGKLPPLKNMLEAYGSVRVNKIVRDRQKRIWLATSAGLFYFDKDMNRLGHLTASATSKISLSNIFVNDVLVTETADKRQLIVWVATRGGVNKLSFQSDSFKLLGNQKILAGSGQNDLFSNWISLLHLDKTGALWAGTIGGGLSRLVNQANKQFSFKTITTEDGFLSNDIETLLEDEEGNFWIGGIGLTKYNPVKNSFSFYDANDGLQSNAFKVWSAFKMGDGEMIFGGINGFNIFYPGQVKKKIDVFSPQLTNLFIINIPVKVGAEVEGDVILNKTLAYSSEIHLNHKIKNFAIEFSSVHSHDFSKIVYRYRLKGYDENWIYANSKKRFAGYSELRAGNYEFEVQASGGGGVWNAVPTVLNIKILPSFFTSTPGYILYLMIIIGGLLLQRCYTLIRLDKEHKLQLEKARQKQDIKLYEEKIQFFTTISHELRTPLTLIMTPIEQVIGQKDLNAGVKSKLELAHKNAQRLKSLMDEILDVRKLELGKFVLSTEEININTVLTSMFIQFEGLAAQKDIGFSFKSSTDAIVRIDIGKFEQVLINLLANAIRCSGGNDKIIIEAFQQFDKVKIEISNTGSYISEQQRSRIFEPFYQVAKKEQTDGSGLGLTIAKYLVELHQGEISVQSFEATSTEAAKTSFIIYLPVVAISESQLQPSIPTTLLANAEKRVNAEDQKNGILKPTVVFVDDNDDLRNLLVDEFQHDYHALEAVDGKQGLKLIRKAKPDMVVTDIMMPVVDGLTLCRALKSDVATRHIPIIILTAKVTDQNKIEGLEAMADDYLCKPFNLRELRIKIRNILHHHENLRQDISNNIALKPVELNFDSRDEKLLKETIAIIENHIDNPDFTVELLCKEAAMSRPVIFRKIKELTGMSIQNFILDIRLKRAAQLLLTRAFTVSEVMYKTGFSSPSYFNKAFKKKYSINPANYADSLIEETI